MMEIDYQGDLRRIAVPGYPGLYLLAADLASYPDELLRQLADCLAQHGVTPSAALDLDVLRGALRRLGRPALLEEHPLAAWVDQPAGQRGAAMEQALRDAIGRLEDTCRAIPRDRRGAIVRLRYIDGLSAKELRSQLYLSESHYHRLHTAALEWLAHDLVRARNPDRG